MTSLHDRIEMLLSDREIKTGSDDHLRWQQDLIDLIVDLGNALKLEHKPDYFYDANERDVTAPDMSMITDGLDIGEIQEVGRLKALPPVYVIVNENDELQEFATLAEATVARDAAWEKWKAENES